MTVVGSSWVEIEWWGDSTGYGDYQARWRCLARSEQNITTNSSTVYFRLQKRVTGGSAYNYNTLDFTITGTGAKGDGHNATQEWTFGSVSSTTWTDVGGDTSDMYWSGVRHRDDGTLSLTATANGDRVLGGTFNTSISIELPTIARASIPTIAPNPITISASTNALTVTTNRKSTSFTHSVTCAIGSYSSTQTGITDTATFDIPNSILSDFVATSKTLDGTITCVTYNGSTQIGTKTATFNAQIDETQEHPNITSVTLTDTNPNSAAIEASGSYIKNATNLSASIILGVVGSHTELASAVVQCGTKQQTYSLSRTSQTITFTYEKLDADALIITVYDKRGTSATQTKTWTLIPYRDITVTGAINRTSETGNTVSFNLNGACFGGSFGSATNSVTVTYRHKLHTASTWTDGSQTFTFTPSGTGETTYNYSNTISGFDYDKQYDIQFTVTDMFTSASTAVLILTTGIPIYGNGSDFFAVYGRQFLHFDRDNPSKYWDLKEGLDAILEYHAKTNLMNINIATQTVSGITFTVNDDGTITANGTASADATLKVGVSKQLDTSKTWYFSGCPSGGSSSTYYCGWETAVVAPEFPPLVMVADTGNGSELIPMWGYPAYCPFYIVIKSGTTVSNLVFKPMIRDVRIASDVFVPNASQIQEKQYTMTSNGYGNIYITDLPNNAVIVETYFTSGNYRMLPMSSSISGTQLTRSFRLFNYATTNTNAVTNTSVTFIVRYVLM